MYQIWYVLDFRYFPEKTSELKKDRLGNENLKKIRQNLILKKIISYV